LTTLAGSITALFFPLSLGIGLLTITSSSVAQDPDAVKRKAAWDGVLKMVEALAKGDAPGVKAGEAVARKADEVHLMNLFLPSRKGGLGVGGKHTPDGIEAWMIAPARRAPSKTELEAKAAELEKAAQSIQSVGQVIQGKRPGRWAAWSRELTDAARDLALAARARKADEVKTIASRITSSCNRCHGVYREN
jgi:cytochrome c556